MVIVFFKLKYFCIKWEKELTARSEEPRQLGRGSPLLSPAMPSHEPSVACQPLLPKRLARISKTATNAIAQNRLLFADEAINSRSSAKIHLITGPRAGSEP